MLAEFRRPPSIDGSLLVNFLEIDSKLLAENPTIRRLFCRTFLKYLKKKIRKRKLKCYLTCYSRAPFIFLGSDWLYPKDGLCVLMNIKLYVIF